MFRMMPPGRFCWCLSKHRLLLILVVILFVMWQVYAYFRYSLTEFTQRVSNIDLKILNETLLIFIQAAESANLTYFLYGGSLLGSYRHHGIIPWDDDVDVMMNSSQKSLIEQTLREYKPRFGVYTHPKTQWKFYYANTNTLLDKPFRWPYVDIFFFQEDKEYIWDELPSFKSSYTLKKSKVFPLRRRPFNGLLLQTPCNPEVSLEIYDVESCAASTYSHYVEQWLPIYKWAKVSCSQLTDRFPFVKRTKIKNGWDEILWNATEKQNHFVAPDNC